MAITFQIDQTFKDIEDWEEQRPRIIAEVLSEYPKGATINWELYLKIKKIRNDSGNNYEKHPNSGLDEHREVQGQ